MTTHASTDSNNFKFNSRCYWGEEILCLQNPNLASVFVTTLFAPGKGCFDNFMSKSCHTLPLLHREIHILGKTRLFDFPELTIFQACNCLFMLLLMAVYWITETFHLAVTSLIPLVLSPMLSIQPAREVCSNYMKVRCVCHMHVRTTSHNNVFNHFD